ncbi:MAG: glycosyltransferase family 39 protein [Candidatus Omnitrophica bacterium]|nr:glycosyltransferase family 39 protein [Candidatus Omnitrophota bacterium]
MLQRRFLKMPGDFWVMAALLTAGLALRFYHLGAPSLGDDELTTAVRINHSFWETVVLLKASSFPPLYYAFLHLWTRLFGTSEWALRFPSALFSGLTIIVIYKLGKELFNKNAGLIAAALLAFSPFAVHYAQYAKMYASFWLLEALSFLFFFRFLRNQGKAPHRWYIATSILCCYTMYSGFLFLAAQNIIFILTGARRRPWFTGQLIILGFCIPWVVLFLCSPKETWGLIRPTAAFDYLHFALSSFFFIIGSGLEIWTHENWAQYSFHLGLWEINCFLYVFLLVFFLVDSPRRADDRAVFLWAAVALLAYFLFDYTCVHVYLEARYVGFLQVPLILMISSRLGAVSGPLRSVMLAAMLMIAIFNIYLYFTGIARFPQQDWRSTAKELMRAAGPNDLIVSYADPQDFSYYYRGDTRRVINIREGTNPAEFLAQNGLLKPRVHAVFLVYKNQMPDGIQPPSGIQLPPRIQLKGFFQDYKVSNGGNGFYHFKRL